MRVKFYCKKRHAEGVENAGFLKKELLDRFLSVLNGFLPPSITMKAPHENQWIKAIRKERTLIRQSNLPFP